MDRCYQIKYLNNWRHIVNIKSNLLSCKESRTVCHGLQPHNGVLLFQAYLCASVAQTQSVPVWLALLQSTVTISLSDSIPPRFCCYNHDCQSLQPVIK